MAHVSEVSRLLVTLGFLPFAWGTVRRLRGRVGQGWVLGAYLLVLAAEIANVAENYAAPVIVNDVQHAAYALAGACMLLAMLRLKAESRMEVRAER